MTTDRLNAFSFDGAPVRGQIVRLTQAWQRIRGDHGYTPAAERMLGEMTAIVAMLAQGIKLNGSVILQIHGDGHVRTAMAECRDRTRLRGILRTDGATEDGDALQNRGRLAITLKPRRGELYQGIVPLETGSVASAVESYFQSSEQLPTRIWAAADQNCAAGLLLQRLPEPQRASPDALERDAESWSRLQILADTISAQELLTVPSERLLLRLFHADALRLQPALDLAFGCSCSAQRTANALRIMGRAEVDQILAQEGAIQVTCEFCGEVYGFDPIDARLLFEPLAGELPATRQ